MPTPRNGVLRHGTRNAYERHKCRCEECTAQNRERRARWVKANREKSRESANASYALHSEEISARRKERYEADKNAAHGKVRRAIERGELVPEPCEQTDSTCSGPIHAHHDDYGKPLEVRWLCNSHHRRWHLFVAKT